MMARKWFSFVEIIIVITIVALLAVIWITVYEGHQWDTMNAKVVADLNTLKWVFTLYKADTSTLPLPLWNTNFYGKNAEYFHSQTGAYGVSWGIRDYILPKKYLNILPMDPRVTEYYAYWKTFGSNEFELAGVITKDAGYESVVVWDYPWKVWPRNLIREYAWDNFVNNGSNTIFPYNPWERTMNAKIISASWTVMVNGIVIPPEDFETTILVSGDTVHVDPGNIARVATSDGSVSIIGEPGSNSEITIAYLDYKGDTFFTKVYLVLKIGTVWVQAAKLDSNSEFNVYTTEAVASVRWTVFGVSKSLSGGTDTTVKVWKVLVSRIPNSSPLLVGDIIDKIAKGQTIETLPIDIPWVTTTGQENGQRVSYMEVPEWGLLSGIEVTQTQAPQVTTPLPTPVEDGSLNNGVSIQSTEEWRSYWTLQYVKFKKDSRFGLVDKIVIDGQAFESGTTIQNALIGTGEVKADAVYIPWYYPQTFSFKVCHTKTLCSRPYLTPMHSGGETMYTNTTSTGTNEEADHTCHGINVWWTCMKNDLYNSWYTLVWVADYTRGNGDLYTINGGKIDWWYTWTWLTTDGFKPSATWRILYLLKNLIQTERFAIELVVSWNELNTNPSSQYLLNGTGTTNSLLYSNYSWTQRFNIGSSSTVTVSTWSTFFDRNTPYYTIRLYSLGSGSALEIPQKNFYYPTTASINMLKDRILVWEKLDWYWSFLWTIRSVKVYQINKKITSWDVSSSESISLQKPLQN